MNNKNGYVYKITSPKNRIYVGSTRNVNHRWNSYKKLKCKDQPKLYNSLKKYGPENHIFEVIWEGLIEDMFKIEYEFGQNLNSLDSKLGLNCRLPKIGENPTFISKEILEKMRKRMLGINNPMYGLKGELNPNYKRKCTEESKLKMSTAQKGKKRSEEDKLKIALASKGRKHSQETKEKISKNNCKYFLNKTFSEEHKLNISKALKGNFRGPMSETHKNNLSLSKKGKKQSNEHKIKSQNAAKKPILQYSLSGEFIKEWDSSADAIKGLEYKSSSCIIACCKNKRKQALKFIWKYKN